MPLPVSAISKIVPAPPEFDDDEISLVASESFVSCLSTERADEEYIPTPIVRRVPPRPRLTPAEQIAARKDARLLNKERIYVKKNPNSQHANHLAGELAGIAWPSQWRPPSGREVGLISENENLKRQLKFLQSRDKTSKFHCPLARKKKKKNFIRRSFPITIYWHYTPFPGAPSRNRPSPRTCDNVNSAVAGPSGVKSHRSSAAASRPSHQPGM